MDFVTIGSPDELVGIRLLGESNQFAIYATGCETYLLVQRDESMPWTGILVSGDAVFRMGGLFSDAMRDLYREMAGHLSPKNREPAPFPSWPMGKPAATVNRATERRELYEDDLTEERGISPVRRDEVAATLILDPIEGNGETGQPLTHWTANHP